jgi:hypothetical protein
MDRATQIDALMASLGSAPQVFGRSGLIGEGDIASEVYTLVLASQDFWQYEADPRSQGPRSASDVADALKPVTETVATNLLVDLSVKDLVFRVHTHGDPEHARRAVRRLVSLLGYDTSWWANIEPLGDAARGWTPVTRHTFDGVIAGVATDGTFVILLQVGED